MDRSIIDRYEAGAEVPARAIVGLTPAQLDAHPIQGTWSIRQIIVHLLESELAAIHRMRRIAGEERPLLISYDESALASNLLYEREDLRAVTDLFADLRRWHAAWLRRMPDGAFDRKGVHNQRGLVGLGEMVGMYVDHLEHHMKFVHEKKVLLGVS
ncbi:MAG TPA: DinB family protein [Phycisphaerales bacterium]|nr:DinB family protein [Phycisphaerales bacterium]